MILPLNANPNNMTGKDVLIQVLILALSAPTEEDAQNAGDFTDDFAAIANDFAANFSPAEVEVCKDVARQVFELMESCRLHPRQGRRA